MMADIPVPQARKGIFERNKWFMFAFTSCLMFITTLWLMFVHVNQEGLLYPHEKILKIVPEHWLQRAIIYNSYDLENVNYTKTIQNSLQEKQLDDLKIVCYYNFPDNSSFKPFLIKNLDPHLCTHINIAFASIVNNSIYIAEENLGFLKDAVDLKANNSLLKVLISVGGAGNNNGFPEMVLSHDNRKQFIKSILQLIKDMKLDGVDLDWEYPESESPGDGKERMHFTQLLYEIRKEINRQKEHKFLLSIAAPAPVFLIETCYDVSYINEYVDFVNLMTYDYHFYTKMTPFTGINAPLFSSEKDVGYLSTLNINYTANYWMHKGLDRKKIIIGLPTYAHSFRLLNADNNGIFAPANGYGNLGRVGFVSYNCVCLFLLKNMINPVFDVTTRSPYATRNHEWVSFDNEESLTFKAEYIRSNFGGAMIYALNTDDYLGVCNGGKKTFPLTNKVREVLEQPQKNL